MARKQARLVPPSKRGNRATQARPEPYNPNNIRYVAAHEAGHAVASVLMGIELKGVDIKRRSLPGGGISLGFTDAPVDAASVHGKGETGAMPFLIQALAGPLAEMLVNHSFLACDGASDNDFSDAKLVAAVAICDSVPSDGTKMEISVAELTRNQGRIDKVLAEANEAARNLVNSNANTILDVAESLIKKTSLTGYEVAALVESRKENPESRANE